MKFKKFVENRLKSVKLEELIVVKESLEGSFWLKRGNSRQLMSEIQIDKFCKEVNEVGKIVFSNLLYKKITTTLPKDNKLKEIF